MRDVETAPVVQGSGAMFDQIAPRYDLLNRLMSFGLDRSWRRKAVAALAPAPGQRVLDLATGTAEIALQIAASHPEVDVVGVDPAARMLAIGRHKAEAAGVADRVQLLVGDGRDLPLPDQSVAGVTMAFGIRNVPAADRGTALVEMRRVTQPGGRIVILELTEPRHGLLAPLARFHVHVVVPWLGRLLSGAGAYRHLQASIERFPPADEFVAMMRGAGLVDVTATPLTFGVCTLFVGAAPAASIDGAAA